MGGKAFVSHLPDATFPRLSPVIYASLKASLLPRLTPLFQHVGVPREAPEKQDHGDVDFIVACPRAAIGLEDIKSALGASTYIPSTQPDGRGTHNFALCLVDVLPADAAPISGEMGEAYVQVDVNIRNDVQGWENVMIFHAYGDLGMIIGRLAASVGLQVGELGLKVSSQGLAPTHPSAFLLSSSIPDIFPFFGLSLERWEAGFATQTEAFEWVASSRFYMPGQVTDGTSRVKSRADRGMYQAFLQWSNARTTPAVKNDGHHQTMQESEDNEAVREAVRGEALAFFGKQEELDALVQANKRRARLKAIWNGKKVGEWVGNNGYMIGRVMRLMRQTIGEEKIGQMTDEEIKRHVLQAKEEVDSQIIEERRAKEGGGEDANET